MWAVFKNSVVVCLKVSYPTSFVFDQLLVSFIYTTMKSIELQFQFIVSKKIGSSIQIGHRFGRYIENGKTFQTW